MGDAWLTTALSLLGAGCIVLAHYLIGSRRRDAVAPASSANASRESRRNKVLVVRNDLKMGKGKIGAQCSHATLGLYKKLIYRAPKALERWEMCGQVKVVLKVESENELLSLQEKAKSLKLPTHITIDAGRTQIAPNSRTVMAVLGPADVVDDVTGGLKLL
ncbi:uncharacterized protein LOC116254202 isoform X2 [Nymphaea colorata]|uniref:uncharacterized protein LOC116254202 isoform X2 n=1 Tax=Nymphaea colorata TaxID=210225 RepID=UPI00129EB37E|nr:uncharacterized protein LOC116254202 isoform X2 [Nymphaea colorata]